MNADEELRELHREFREHMAQEMPAIEAIRELGNSEQVRSYRAFLDVLLEREKDRVALRRAIIEKSLIGAVWALLVFVAVSIWHELKRP